MSATEVDVTELQGEMLIPPEVLQAGAAALQAAHGVLKPELAALQAAREIARLLVSAGRVVLDVRMPPAPPPRPVGGFGVFEPVQLRLPERIGATPREVFGHAYPTDLQGGDNDRVYPLQPAYRPSSLLPYGPAQAELRALQRDIDDDIAAARRHQPRETAES